MESLHWKNESVCTKWAVKSHIYTLLGIVYVNCKHKTIIDTFLFETKFMIWKCINYKQYEHSEVFLIKSHKYLDAKLNSILLYNNIADCDMHWFCKKYDNIVWKKNNNICLTHNM